MTIVKVEKVGKEEYSNYDVYLEHSEPIENPNFLERGDLVVHKDGQNLLLFIDKIARMDNPFLFLSIKKRLITHYCNKNYLCSTYNKVNIDHYIFDGIFSNKEILFNLYENNLFKSNSSKYEITPETQIKDCLVGRWYKEEYENFTKFIKFKEKDQIIIKEFAGEYIMLTTCYNDYTDLQGMISKSAKLLDESFQIIIHV